MQCTSIAFVLPKGAASAKDVFIFVNGNREASASEHDFDFTSSTISGSQLWLDASNLDNADSVWNDISGNNNHATKHGSPQIIKKASQWPFSHEI